MTKGYWGNGSAFPWAERTSLWGSANTVVACFTGMIDFLHRYSCEVNSRYVLDTVGIFLCVGVFFFCFVLGFVFVFFGFFCFVVVFLCFVCLFFNFLFFFYFTFSFYSGCHGGRKKPELKSSAVVFYWELNWRLTPSAHRINSLATAC